AFVKREVEKRAAASAWSLHQRHGVICCIVASPCMIAVGALQILTGPSPVCTRHPVDHRRGRGCQPVKAVKKRQAGSLCSLFSLGCYDCGACQGHGIGCSILTRFPSVSVNETYCPTPGISSGSPSTVPPASVTRLTASVRSSTAITIAGCCAGQSGFFGKKPPLIAPGCVGPCASVSVVVAST